jgi:DNA-directed RNA polymerase specialized sigma24 family protein
VYPVPRATLADPSTAVDHRTSPQAAMEATDSVAHLKAVLAPRWFDVLWGCFAEGRQLTEIASDVGCTRSRVRQRIQDAIGHARRKLKGETHVAEAVPPTSTGRFGTHACST